MRLVSIFSILLFSFCSACFGQATTSTAAQKIAPEDSQLSANGKLNQLINANLNQPIDFNFNETPWSQVEMFLEKTLDVNFVLTSSAIDDSLSADEPISCRLQGMPVKSALRIVLEQKNATFLVQDSVVKIISLDDAEDAKYFNNHFINVRPLLANISKLESNRIGKPRLTQQKHPGGGMVAGGPSAAQAKSTGVTTAESMLIDLIQTSVYPDNWKDSGQGLATIKIIGGYIVVSCPESLADSLKDFLQDLSFHLSRE